MAKPKTRLEKVRLHEVSVVDRPANPGADLLLFKREAPMTDVPAVPPEDGDEEPETAQLFADVRAEEKAEQKARQMLDPLWDFTSALRSSLQSISEDDSVTDKVAMAQASLDQFASTVIRLFKGETVEKIAAALVEPEAGDAGRPLTKGAIPMADEITKGDDVVTISKADLALLKADAAAATAANAVTTAAIAKMQDDQALAVCVAKAASLTNLPVDPAKFAAVLKNIPAADQDEIMRVLSAANACIGKGHALTGELGTSIEKAAGESPLIKKIKADAEAAKGKC